MYVWVWKWVDCQLYFFMLTRTIDQPKPYLVDVLYCTAEEVGQMLGGN